MNRINSLVFIFLVISVGCIYGYDELFEYKLILIKSFKQAKDWCYLGRDQSFKLHYESPESFIKMPTCMKVDRENKRILIIDNNRHQVKVFSKKGDFIKSVGQPGQGPGDMNSPYWLEFCRDKICICSNGRIDFFDKNLNFKSRLRVFLPFPRFFVFKDYIYAGISAPYREKYPLFVKMDINGRVQDFVIDDDMNDHFFRKIKDDIFILFANERVIVVPMHWNKIYIYDNQLKLIRKRSINYPLLDKVEEWNLIKDMNRKKNSRIYWPCRMTASAKLFEDKVYILLNLPRLEILVLDHDGKIKIHFYNDNDFQLMKWKDFDIQEEKGKIIFYILGYSLEDEKTEMSDYNVYRMIDGETNKASDSNMK
ncbi:MAG: 6-bladed beta-propeller [Candidatus Aminicenantes bacterium]|nr:6-bladed beta-propeller [Candidatus Aminicenantes bacterium]